VGADLFHPDGWTDGQKHEEGNSRFSQFCERSLNFLEPWGPVQAYTEIVLRLPFT